MTNQNGYVSIRSLISERYGLSVLSSLAYNETLPNSVFGEVLHLRALYDMLITGSHRLIALLSDNLNLINAK